MEKISWKIPYNFIEKVLEIKKKLMVISDKLKKKKFPLKMGAKISEATSPKIVPEKLLKKPFQTLLEEFLEELYEGVLRLSVETL